MQSETTRLSCAGCERSAPANAKPDPCGLWLCRRCTADVQWAMAWMDAVWPKGGPVVTLEVGNPANPA